MTIEEVVADANVLLSAVLGKAALRVFTEFEVTVHVAQFNVDEVAEYLPRLAAQYDLPAELVKIQWKLLPVRVYEVRNYDQWLDNAVDDLRGRDTEDDHPLALARSLKIPLWSNDRDLQGHDVRCYSAAQLLRILESRPSKAGGR